MVNVDSHICAFRFDTHILYKKLITYIHADIHTQKHIYVTYMLT